MDSKVDWRAGVQDTEQSGPFLTHDVHKDGKTSGRVLKAKRHDVKSFCCVIWEDECQFPAVQPEDGNLMVARFGIKTDPIEATGPRSQIVERFVATRDRELRGP